MKKLENISKKEIFNVPEGYFETLPGKIQTRISTERPVHEPQFFYRYKLQYALPVVALLSFGIYWFTSTQQPSDAESILASVQTEELVAFLDESELTTEDLLEDVEFNSTDVDEIETELYELDFNDEDLNEVFGDFESENI